MCVHERECVCVRERVCVCAVCVCVRECVCVCVRERESIRLQALADILPPTTAVTGCATRL